MTPDQVARFISFVGTAVQFGSALLLCGLFWLLSRHAARRAYFGIWARAWLVMVLSLAVVLAYSAPGAMFATAPDPGLLQLQVVRFSYTFTKLLTLALLVVGTRMYGYGAHSRRDVIAGTAVALAVGAATLLPTGIRAATIQAPFVIAAFAYCGATLLGLPHSRRSLGSRMTGVVFAAMAVLWCAWLLAFTNIAFQSAETYNGYLDALLQMLLGSGMIVMLMEDAKREADDARAELAVAHDKLRRDALYDSLTGSLNRRAFAEGVGLEMARATFGAVVVLDMDNLKTVNDSAGHAGGDELLQHLSDTLRAVIRPSDRLYRWGGDEFLLIFPGAHATDVQARVEQAIAEAERLAIAGLPDPVRLVASVGSADYASAEDLDGAIERADGVMYRQKKARRAKGKDATPMPVPARAG